MTRAIGGLREIADTFDVAVLDQWGVLHDGTRPYPHVARTLAALAEAGKRIVVLSNSGKRSDPNLERIARCGVPTERIELAMTSGEALWRDLAEGRLPFRTPLALTGHPDDARRWADGLPVTLADGVEGADALLLMGLADGAGLDEHMPLLEAARARDLPAICSNPDRASPRANGQSALQPGALADNYEAMGGTVRWYGKPHDPVFRAVEAFTGAPPARHLMVGDSPQHDVQGAHEAGWNAALVRDGLHGAALADGSDATVRSVCEGLAAPLPDAHMDLLRW